MIYRPPVYLINIYMNTCSAEMDIASVVDRVFDHSKRGSVWYNAMVYAMQFVKNMS